MLSIVYKLWLIHNCALSISHLKMTERSLKGDWMVTEIHRKGDFKMSERFLLFSPPSQAFSKHPLLRKKYILYIDAYRKNTVGFRLRYFVN